MEQTLQHITKAVLEDHFVVTWRYLSATLSISPAIAKSALEEALKRQPTDFAPTYVVSGKRCDSDEHAIALATESTLASVCANLKSPKSEIYALRAATTSTSEAKSATPPHPALSSLIPSLTVAPSSLSASPLMRLRIVETTDSAAPNSNQPPIPSQPQQQPPSTTPFRAPTPKPVTTAIGVPQQHTQPATVMKPEPVSNASEVASPVSAPMEEDPSPVGVSQSAAASQPSQTPLSPLSTPSSATPGGDSQQQSQSSPVSGVQAKRSPSPKKPQKSGSIVSMFAAKVSSSKASTAASSAPQPAIKNEPSTDSAEIKNAGATSSSTQTQAPVKQEKSQETPKPKAAATKRTAASTSGTAKQPPAKRTKKQQTKLGGKIVPRKADGVVESNMDFDEESSDDEEAENEQVFDEEARAHQAEQLELEKRQNEIRRTQQRQEQEQQKPSKTNPKPETPVSAEKSKDATKATPTKKRKADEMSSEVTKNSGHKTPLKTKNESSAGGAAASPDKSAQASITQFAMGGVHPPGAGSSKKRKLVTRTIEKDGEFIQEDHWTDDEEVGAENVAPPPALKASSAAVAAAAKASAPSKSAAFPSPVEKPKAQPKSATGSIMGFFKPKN